MVRSITTSQSRNAPAAGGSPPEAATFDSVPSNSRGPPSSAALMLATAGSGS
jgi:hypothetical protein